MGPNFGASTRNDRYEIAVSAAAWRTVRRPRFPLIAAGLDDGPSYPVRMCEAYFMRPRNLDEAEKPKLLGKSRMPRLAMGDHCILGAVNIGLSNFHVGRIGG